MSKTYVYSDFSSKDALYAVIAGVRFQVVQYASSWAVNEIPTAACMLAIGREARTQVKAAIHSNANQQQMVKAQVFFTPSLEYSLTQNWPPGTKMIFDGFLAGFTFRKINGKIHAVGRLLHWLAALTFSSSLTASGHVANHSQLNATAVIRGLRDTGVGQGNYISQLVGAQLTGNTVLSDTWVSIKNILCKLASIPTLPVSAHGECGGGGQARINTAALAALQRIEGPAASCPKPYKWGKPLAINADSNLRGLLADAIALSLGAQAIESYSAMTFWDKMIGEFFPSLGMAIVPRVNDAVVIADTPAYSGGFWRQIVPDEYDDLNMDSDLHHPLQAVSVLVGWTAQTLLSQNEITSDGALIGGCFAAPGVSGTDADGIRMYIGPPPWLQMLNSVYGYAQVTTGLAEDMPTRSATTPVTPPTGTRPTPGPTGGSQRDLYERYAQTYYVNQILRGRSGSNSGKLRFDIAPGSIIKLLASTEKFIGAEDDLAFTQFGCVTRISMAINAESSMAGTTLLFDHKRTLAENSSLRTSVPNHPLFGNAIHGNGKHGAPLTDDYEFSDGLGS